MNRSESIAELSKALTKAWGDINNPKHNRKVTVRMKSGGSYKFEYTDLGGILDEVKPHFKENGVSIVQHAYTEIIEGKPFVSVVTKLLHSSGEWLESKPLQLPANPSIQDMGGQITYMKRYSLSAMLGISTEEDDDANAASGNEVEYHNAPKQKQPLKATLLSKYQLGGKTKEEFEEWYQQQKKAGKDHVWMDQALTRALADKK